MGACYRVSRAMPERKEIHYSDFPALVQTAYHTIITRKEGGEDVKVPGEQFVRFEWRPCPSDIDERDAADEKGKGEFHSPKKNTIQTNWKDNNQKNEKVKWKESIGDTRMKTKKLPQR